jgi:L-2,4-diaminobutyric acid acetyltransferase
LIDTECPKTKAVAEGRGEPVDRLAGFSFRNPVAEDARGIFDLIASCPPLDGNSLYCNLLQCTHFAGTCIVAERDGEPRGWISGYRVPGDRDAMFVWQVAVHRAARGEGLGAAMLNALFDMPAVRGAARLVTTVTPSNHASRAMFARFARQRGLDLDIRPMFDRERHFGNAHESEELITIGPLPAGPTQF